MALKTTMVKKQGVKIIWGLLLCFIGSLSLHAQSLKFDKKFYEGLNQWVVFEGLGNPAKHVLGVVYLDPISGFSFRHESMLILSDGHLEQINKQDSSIVTSRLSPDLADVAMLPEIDRKRLNLPVQPSWLSVYLLDSDKLSYQVSLGRAYNGIGACDLALPILSEVYKKEPHTPGLEFELAYAYNHLGSFYKAIVLLNAALEHDPNNFWLYRELGFSLKHLEKVAEADKAYQKAMSLTQDPYQKSEIAINMLQSYFHVRNREKFEAWKSQLNKYAEADSKFLEYLNFFEENWNLPQK